MSQNLVTIKPKPEEDAASKSVALSEDASSDGDNKQGFAAVSLPKTTGISAVAALDTSQKSFEYTQEQTAELDRLEEECKAKFPSSRTAYYSDRKELIESVKSWSESKGLGLSVQGSCIQCKRAKVMKSQIKKSLEKIVKTPEEKRRKPINRNRCDCPFVIKFTSASRRIEGIPKGAVRITEGSYYRHGGGCFPGVKQPLSIQKVKALKPKTKARSFDGVRGVYPVLPTPFTEDGELDAPSLRRLIEYQKNVAHVNGVSILGLTSETTMLSSTERQTVIETAIEEADEMEVWVGVRAMGTIGCVEQSVFAEKMGAKALFVAPVEVQDDTVLYDHFKTVALAVKIPVMIHDCPPAFKVTVSAELIARLAKNGLCSGVKLEDAPVGPKISKLRRLTNDQITIFGGLGGIYLIEELDRGAQGIATGFAFPHLLVQICNLHFSGEQEAARKAFDQYASLLRYEFQPKLALALRKHAYYRRGIFSSPHVRSPGTRTLDDETMLEWERTIVRAGLQLGPVALDPETEVA